MQDFVRLTEVQVAERFVAVEARKKRILERKAREERRRERKRQALEMARRLEQVKSKKRFDLAGRDSKCACVRVRVEWDGNRDGIVMGIGME